MRKHEAPCIYCPTIVDLRQGEGDHVIFAALGRFKDEFRFHRICGYCHTRIVTSGEQLLRCAPEAYLRRIVQPTVQRNRRGKSWAGANGIPPPRFTVDRGDHHELVHASTDNPRNVSTIDQLVLVDKGTGENFIRLSPQMTVKTLRAKIAAL